MGKTTDKSVNINDPHSNAGGAAKQTIVVVDHESDCATRLGIAAAIFGEHRLRARNNRIGAQDDTDSRIAGNSDPTELHVNGNAAWGLRNLGETSSSDRTASRYK